MEERWFSVDEIAAYLGIKRDTVYKWISEKQMPAHRMGRLWKFKVSQVDQWVEAGKANDRPKNTDEKNQEDRMGDRKSTRLNSSHTDISRMPSSA